MFVLYSDIMNIIYDYLMPYPKSVLDDIRKFGKLIRYKNYVCDSFLYNEHTKHTISISKFNDMKKYIIPYKKFSHIPPFISFKNFNAENINQYIRGDEIYLNISVYTDFFYRKKIKNCRSIAILDDIKLLCSEMSEMLSIKNGTVFFFLYKSNIFIFYVRLIKLY